MLKFISNRANRTGRLIAYKRDSGATQYQVDGPLGTHRRYKVLGLLDPENPYADTLEEAREMIRADWENRKKQESQLELA